MNPVNFDQYPYFRDLQSGKNHITVTDPLQIPEVTSPEWKQLRRVLEKDPAAVELKSQGHLDISDHSQFLIRGTLNLINFIITESQTRPIDTIFFLDKSARPAAYFFRVLWTNLKQQMKIPNINRPAIKFINIGKDEPTKDAATAARQLLIDHYGPQQGTVLIVDEIIGTGDTAQKAMRILDPISEHVSAISQFSTTPWWYHYPTHKGIADTKIPPDVYDFVNQFSEHVFQALRTLILSEHDETSAVALVDYFATQPADQILAKYHGLVPDSSLIETHIALKRTGNLFRLHLVRYFKKAGGFISEPAPQRFFNDAANHRAFLAKLSQEASRLIQLNQT